MRPDTTDKYRPFPPIAIPDRQWPNQVITQAPVWCSVDLRDGNQALVDPMGIDRKTRMFQHLVAMGFKEIEVGFPAASDTDFGFLRHLVEKGMIPDDVTIQVLTQAREALIERTFEALKGVKKAIVHLYNSTSTAQRRVVFGLDRDGVKAIAVEGAKHVKRCAEAQTETEVTYQYSPESFTGTELDYAVEVCEAVMDVWRPTPDKPMIVNLPATVEMATPNVFADQVEWFCRTVKDRDSIIASIHPHNDRGSAVAAAELAMMAGADRVEGTLFGNGERTGNVDVVTLALNLFTQGVEPGLDVSDIDATVEMATHCTGLPVHPRHPYAGELVYTAFSGSHQDAIKKGFAARRTSNSGVWEVPYLPIDPEDVGRTYEAVIRVNSQSGKGGVAWVMEKDHGVEMPRGLQVDFSRVVQAEADRSGEEVGSARVWEMFEAEYLAPAEAGGPVRLVEYATVPDTHASEVRRLTATVAVGPAEVTVEGRGNGPVDAFADAVSRHFGVDFTVADYHEHAVGRGADAQALCTVAVETRDGRTVWGVGRHGNIVAASYAAVLSALVRAGVVVGVVKDAA